MRALLGVRWQIPSVEIRHKLLNLCRQTSYHQWPSSDIGKFCKNVCYSDLAVNFAINTTNSTLFCSYLESKLLIEKERWVGGRDMQSEVFSQVGLDEVVEHEGGNAMAPPGRVHRQVGEVGLTPPWQNSLKKDQITNTDLQSGTTRPKPTQSLL